MRLARIRENVSKYKSDIEAVRGINYGDNLQEGDLREAVNLTSRRFPHIAARRARGMHSTHEAATALYAWDKLVVVDGNSLLYDGEVIGAVTAGEKQFAVVGDKLCIFPDKVSVSVKDGTFDSLDKRLVTPGGAVLTSSTLTVPDATLGKEYIQGGTYKLPFETLFFKTYTSLKWQNGAWVRTGGELTDLGNIAVGQIFIPKRDGYSWAMSLVGPNGSPEENSEGFYGVIKSFDFEAQMVGAAVQYTVKNIRFDVFDATATKFVFTGSFIPGNEVVISGLTTGGPSEVVAKVKAVNDNVLTFEDGTFTAGTNSGELTIRKNVPDLDYICGVNGRLWGVSNKTNTVYASALGKPEEFSEYQGLSTDSYTLEIISKGKFTAMYELGDAILLWKEDKLHKILGDTPADYYMYTYDIEGVQDGCFKSLQIINETLFYVGLHGVYTYGGATPTLVSERFGDRAITDAVAGTDGVRYYLSAKLDGEQGLFVFDTERGIWMREDDVEVVDFARMGKDLYFAAYNTIWQADSGAEDPNVQWMAQYAPFYETLNGRKTYSKLIIRLELPQGSWVKAELRTDGGTWKTCATVKGTKNDAVSMRLPVMRCDKFEVRLTGKGPCAVLGMMREFMLGSDV